MSEELKEAIAALEAAQEKLKLYRMAHSGEYIGGVEYTDLQERISGSIFNLTVYAAKQEADDGRMLQELPEGTFFLSFETPSDKYKNWLVKLNGEFGRAQGEGHTSHAAIQNAIAKIPKQDKP